MKSITDWLRLWISFVSCLLYLDSDCLYMIILENVNVSFSHSIQDGFVPPCLFVFTGWYSGLCQSLQRHLRVLGVRLPAGPHLSDTSLLLGSYQSQLPREQLRLAWPQRTTAPRDWENPTFSILILFRFHVQSRGCLQRCLDRSVLKRWMLRVGGVSYGVCVWNVFHLLNKLLSGNQPSNWSTEIKILPRVCRNYL